jgi:hypothetical protein
MPAKAVIEDDRDKYLAVPDAVEISSNVSRSATPTSYAGSETSGDILTAVRTDEHDSPVVKDTTHEAFQDEDSSLLKDAVRVGYGTIRTLTPTHVALG